MNKQPRVDGAEEYLLLSELRYFKDTLGFNEVSRVIGRPYDVAFIADCIGVIGTTKDLRERGYPFDARIVPTAELERALRALWDAAPQKDLWREMA